MSTSPAQQDPFRPVARPALYFGLWGGTVAWTFHLGLAYLIAEFGCLASVARYTLLGVTSVAWLIIAVSALMLALAAAATLVAYRADHRLRSASDSLPEAAEAYVARLGLTTSALLTLVIAVQSVPVFFYLGHC